MRYTHTARQRRGARENASPELLAEALAGLGRIKIDVDDLDAALDHYREVEQIRRALGETIELAHTLRRMPDVLRHQQRLEEAEQAYIEAVSIYRGNESRCALDLANALRGLALLAASKGLVGAAIDRWREARLLYEVVGIRAGVEESDRQLRNLAGSSPAER